MPVCAKGAASGWESGWIVFADADGDNERTPAEPLLRVQPAMPDSGGIQRSGGTAYNQLRYRPNGWAAGATATLRFMPKSPGDRLDMALSRTVCVSILGRTRVLPTGDAACS